MGELAGDIDRAREALETDAPASALAPLLEAWRAARHPRIAALIDRVSERLLAERGPIKAKTVKLRTAAWIERAKQRDAGDVGSLLATPWPGTWKDALPVLEVLIDLPHDPRIAMALARILEKTPYDTWTATKFWAPLVAHLGRLHDVRTLPILDTDLERTKSFWWERDTRPLVRSARASIASAPSVPLDRTELAALARVEALFVGQVSVETATAKGEADFLAAIHADPDDDALRMVYADWLGERGDPRGELITLQLARHQGRSAPASLRREASLLAKHGKAWLGPLDHVLDKRGRVFERGFLARATVGFDGERPSKLPPEMSDPRWATVHTVCATWSLNVAGLAAPFMKLPALRFVRTLRGFDERAIAELAAGPPNPRLVEISVEPIHGADPEGRRQISEGSAFPNVRRFGVHSTIEQMEPFLAGALAKRVERVTQHHFDLALRPLVRLVEQLGLPASEVAVAYDNWSCVLSRDARGRFTRLHASPEVGRTIPTAHRFEVVLRTLAAEDLTELTVDADVEGTYDAGTIEMLEKQLARFATHAVIRVPWERLALAPRDRVAIRLALRGTGKLDAARLAVLWQLVGEPPVSLAFDAFAVNLRGHNTLDAGGLAQATALLAKKRTKQLDFYDKSAPKTRRLEIRDGRLEIVCDTSEDDVADRYLEWLARLVGVIGVNDGDVPFVTPEYERDFDSRQPFDRRRQWLWLLPAELDRVLPFDELEQLPRSPALSWLRATRLGAHFAFVFGPRPDRPPRREQFQAFEDATEALWAARGRPRRSPDLQPASTRR